MLLLGDKTSVDSFWCIQENAVRIIDHRAATSTPSYATLEQRFDMTGRSLAQVSCDAGESWLFADVAGKPIWTREARGFEQWRSYDALRRILQVEVQDPQESTIVVETYEYGEAAPDAVTHNLKTKLWHQNDGAGRLIFSEYDFKGNLHSSTREVLQDATLTTPDWSQSPVLGQGFTTEVVYDALNRPTTTTLPDGSQIVHSYNKAGLLEQVRRTPAGGSEQLYVSNIDYNEKGQRAKIEYGNGVVTEYTYDPLTFRLQRLLSMKSATVLQDLDYTYDAVGNITRIADASQEVIYYDQSEVHATQDFAYDPLYRLASATGREQIGQTGIADQEYGNLPAATDLSAFRNYTQSYSYDSVGNITEMHHEAGRQAGSYYVNWTRVYSYADDSNRLQSTIVGQDTRTYGHDAAGDMVKMPHLSGASENVSWNYKNQMVSADKGGGGTVYFQYDAAGQRVRKCWDKGSDNQDERVYLAGFEIFRRRVAGDPDFERSTVHLLDDQRRVALIETKTLENGAEIIEPVSLDRYQLDNHLRTSCIELDDDGGVISFEEYYPYGTTSFQAPQGVLDGSAKRYRYTGKERDEETGLYYHGARYYAPWLGRWTSADPSRLSDGINRFAYVGNNPVTYRDPNGHKREPTDFAFGLALMGVSPANYAAHMAAYHPGFDPLTAGSVAAEGVQHIAGAVGRYAEEHPRASGALRLAGGVTEGAVAGGLLAAPEPTGLTKVAGWGLAVHAASEAAAGVMQLITGKSDQSVVEKGISKGLEKSGISPETAHYAAGVLNATLGAAGTAFGLRTLGAVPSLAIATRRRGGRERGN